MPRVLALDPRSPDAGVVAEAARVLRQGGLVAIPTETVYGLGARALDENALARVFAAKGRPTHHPLIAHVLGEAQAIELASSWPDAAALLARSFWPGPITLVVERAGHVPASITGGGGSIAVRAPSHPVARAVIAALGEPVAAPSANRYQGLSPTRAEHVVKQLGDAVDLVLDAGPCDAGIESTVVDVREEPPRVLRPGAVTVGQLRGVLPRGVTASAERAEERAARPSPGMDARHYAPRARLVVADSWEEARLTVQRLASQGARVGAALREGADAVAAVASPSHGSGAVVVRLMPHDPAGYARVLYATLHELDDAGVDAIVVQGVPQDDAWWAIADRLSRATRE
jgi:L-threonylcarbamoyladenylate synthase